MHFSSTLGFLACMISSVLSSPASITTAPTPTAAACSGSYATTTTYGFHACPDICVEAGSPLCPVYACPFIPVTCPTGSSLITPPATAPTTIVGSTTQGCTVTVSAVRGCALCGCLGCPRCE